MPHIIYSHNFIYAIIGFGVIFRVRDKAVKMISYRQPRTRANKKHQELAAAQAQIKQLKIENQALLNQLADRQNNLCNSTISPKTLADTGFDSIEKLFDYFLDYSSIQAFINSTDGHYQFVNSAFASYLETAPEDIVGHSLYEFFSNEAARSYLAINQDVFNNRKMVKTIEPVQNKSGKISYVLTSVFPLPVRPGLEWVGGLATDITDYVLIEKASKRNEERLHQLINQLPVFLFDIDAKGIITLLEGKGYNSQAGLAHSLLGKSIQELFNNHPEIIEYYRRAMAGESIHTIIRISPDKIYEIRCSPVFDEKGRFKNLTGLALDITTQTQMWEKLRQSEQRFIKIFHSAPLAIAICRVAEGTFIDVNPAFTNLTGYTGEEIAEKSLFELLENIPDYRETAQGLSNAKPIQPIRNREISIENKRQERLTVLVSTEQVDFDGEKCLIITCLDITEQKKAEVAKRETEERLQAILDYSPVFIFAKDKEGRYIMFNRYCERYSNLLAKDVIGKTTYEAYGGDRGKADFLVELDKQVLTTGQAKVIEDESLINGKLFCDITTKFPMFDANGQAYAVGGISIDITDRKIAEKALAAEKEQLAVTLSSIADGVITTNTDDRILLINRVAQEITGWSQEEAQQEPLGNIFKIIDAQTRQPVSCPVSQGLATGKQPGKAAPTFLLLSKDGSERPLEVSTAPIFDGQGQVSGSVLVFRDISEKLKMIEEHQKVARLESLGLLAGGIAHDFNNLLTAIVGSISVARVYGTKPGMQKKLDQSLERAEKACLQSKELTQQLLTFAKGGAPIKQRARLPELIQESANFVLQGSRVQRHYKLPADTWLVEVDPGQVSQVIQNLVLNAVQAMPEGGKLVLATENLAEDHPDLKRLSLAEGRFVRFTVTDNGTGIPPENLTRIFDPYYTTKETGNGLGLAICYSVIRNHLGHIEVESQPNQGTKFNVYLPATGRGQVDVPATLSSPKQVRPDHLKARILVMEDDLTIRTLLLDILDLLGYEVGTSQNGEQALQLYEEAFEAKNPFAAVIMDLNIPGGMGGWEAVRKLKERFPQARAIVSSGYTNDLVLLDFKRMGFDGLISKPYRVKDLEAVLEAVIQN